MAHMLIYFICVLQQGQAGMRSSCEAIASMIELDLEDLDDVVGHGQAADDGHISTQHINYAMKGIKDDFELVFSGRVSSLVRLVLSLSL